MAVLTSVTLPWGDGEYCFHLDILQLEELERQTGTAATEVFRRLADGTPRIKDIRETIRLGLLGGGVSPQDAVRLVKQYVDQRPILESVAIAAMVIGAAIVGNRPDEESDEGNAPAAGPKKSTSPRSKRRP